MYPLDRGVLAFKVDENLPRALVSLLNDSGFDARSVQDQGLSGSDDRKLIDTCTRERRVLISLDKGFADLTSYPLDTHSGVIVLRLPRLSGAGVLRLASRIVPMLEAEASLSGQLWIVDEKRIRVRRHRDDV